MFEFSVQKYRANAEPPKTHDAETGVSDFDKLLENNTKDDENRVAPIAAEPNAVAPMTVIPISAAATAVVASPPVKAVKKKTVRASHPMKFKITKVILKQTQKTIYSKFINESIKAWTMNIENEKT